MTHVVLDPPAGTTVQYGGDHGGCHIEAPITVALSDWDPVETDPTGWTGDVIYGLYDPPPTIPGLTPGCCARATLKERDITVDATADLTGIDWSTAWDGDDPPVGVVIRPRMSVTSAHPVMQRFSIPGAAQEMTFTVEVDGDEFLRLHKGPAYEMLAWSLEFGAAIPVSGLDNDNTGLAAVTDFWAYFGDPFWLSETYDRNEFVFWGPANGGTLPETVDLHFEVIGVHSPEFGVSGCGASQRPDAECIGVSVEPYANFLPNILDVPEVPLEWSVDVYPVCLIEPSAAGMHVV